MSCAVCGESTGFFGVTIAFTCPVCEQDICQECAEKYGDGKSYGGFFSDEHAEITCPNCHSTIKIR